MASSSPTVKSPPSIASTHASSNESMCDSPALSLHRKDGTMGQFLVVQQFHAVCGDEGLCGLAGFEDGVHHRAEGRGVERQFRFVNAYQTRPTVAAGLQQDYQNREATECPGRHVLGENLRCFAILPLPSGAPWRNCNVILGPSRRGSTLTSCGAMA